jgi:hypothetical protein
MENKPLEFTSARGDVVVVCGDNGIAPSFLQTTMRGKPSVMLDCSAGPFTFTARFEPAEAREMAAALVAAADHAEGIQPIEVPISADEKQAIFEVAS